MLSIGNTEMSSLLRKEEKGFTLLSPEGAVEKAMVEVAAMVHRAQRGTE